MTKFHFDPDKHLYTVDGGVVPSVTEILKPCYDFSMVPESVLERKRIIGSKLHSAIELDHLDQLDESSVSDDVMPYFNAWRQFAYEMGPRLEVIDFERPLYSSLYRFAGTYDINCLIDGDYSLLDPKTVDTLSEPAVGLQLAGYRQLCEENYGRAWREARRFALHLTPARNPKFRLVELTQRSDLSVFLGLVRFHYWKAQNKIK